MTYPEQLKNKKLWQEWREKTNYPELTLKGIKFKGDDLSDYDFMYINFVDCSFEDATLHETNFRLSTLERCSFKNAKFWQTRFEDVDVRTCYFNDFPSNCFTEGAFVTPRQMALIDGMRKKMHVLEKGIAAPRNGLHSR